MLYLLQSDNTSRLNRQKLVKPLHEDGNGSDVGDISGMKIMKSLPVLNKQGGNMPDSARGEHHK